MATIQLEMLILTLASIAIGGGLAWIISRSVTHPLRQLQGLRAGSEQRLRLYPADAGEQRRRDRADAEGDQRPVRHAAGQFPPGARRGQPGHRLVDHLSGASREMSSISHSVSESSASMAAGVEQVTVSIGHVAERSDECDRTAREAGRRLPPVAR